MQHMRCPASVFFEIFPGNCNPADTLVANKPGQRGEPPVECV